MYELYINKEKLCIYKLYRVGNISVHKLHKWMSITLGVHIDWNYVTFDPVLYDSNWMWYIRAYSTLLSIGVLWDVLSSVCVYVHT